MLSGATDLYAALGQVLAWRNVLPFQTRGINTILLLRERDRRSLESEINVTSKQETVFLLEKLQELTHISGVSVLPTCAGPAE